MQKITPFFWFNDQAEEAVHFYRSIFKNSKILDIAYYGDAGAQVSGKTPGTVMTIRFELDGQEFIALNGGPLFTFSVATSFVVNCETQAEVDHYWEKLSAGGAKSQCGWLKDKFGMSWQVVPGELPALMQSAEPEKRNAVMQAILEMDKLDIARLKRAAGLMK